MTMTTIGLQAQHVSRSGRHSDIQLVNAIMEANPDLKERVKFSPGGNISKSNNMYYCNQATNIWSQVHNSDIERVLRTKFEAMNDVLSESEKRHIMSKRGRADLVNVLGAIVIDDGFYKHLDTKLPENCIAFENGMFNASTGRLRPFVPKDWISKTIGYRFEAAEDDYVDFIAKFYEQVFPIPKEREYFLRIIANALFAREQAKHFIVLTDGRDGSSGKTTIMRVLEKVFGEYKSIADLYFISESSNPNRVVPSLLAYSGKRLAFFDEPYTNYSRSRRRIDLDYLEYLTSGDAYIYGKKSNTPVIEKARWESLIVFA
jgi:hypothetical protein